MKDVLGLLGWDILEDDDRRDFMDSRLAVLCSMVCVLGAWTSRRAESLAARWDKKGGGDRNEKEKNVLLIAKPIK